METTAAPPVSHAPTATSAAQTGPAPSNDDVKPEIRAGEDLAGAEEEENDTEGDDAGEDDLDPLSTEGNIKRPRLRLAHACDRCRKRKIRCDTQQPCGPCQAAKTGCTFQSPSRRTSKPKISGEGNIRSSSGGGMKRPHSPPRGEAQAALEARLAALEAMLRDVPPNVHNAFLSSLDARLGGGVGVGLKEGGGGEGVGIAPEVLSGSSSTFSGKPGTSSLQQWVLSAAANPHQNALHGLEGITGFESLNDIAGLPHRGRKATGGWGSSGLANRVGRIGQMREEEGVDAMAKKMEGMSFFYEDEIGQAKWQGATSGFPLLSLLTAANVSDQESKAAGLASSQANAAASASTSSGGDRRTSHQAASSLPISGAATSTATSPSIGMNDRRASTKTASSSQPSTSPQEPKNRFFPDRNPRPHQTLNPEASWRAITSVIPPDLMDTLVRCYLSTSHLLWPFLHVPSFLADYATPNQWGEPGFACFIVAVCTLSSRHVDDPRVRAHPSDPSTAGKHYFELFKRLRDVPAADRPTLYSTQAAFLAAVYAFGLGNLSKAFALLAESITLCLDGGLHRSVDGYDHFDAIEKEIRKRTFWSIYSWDKQSAALFGRPPVIHLRDCDVTEPLIVDDENLTPEGVQEEESHASKSRLYAFRAAIRLHVILEGVIDSATQPSTFPTSPFLAKAAAIIARRSTQHNLVEEEALLDEWERILPKYWHYDQETAGSRDPIRITQAERLHCLQHLVKMIIYRHRFSGFVVEPASTAEERARHLDASRKAMQCALTIIADHVHISQRGMMTYYGVHVIHQLAQAGRTLVAVILNCRNAETRPLVNPAIEGLRSCVGLLRRFSGRYLCGLRSADIIDEFCRICSIPIDTPRVPDSNRPSPAWLRPVRKRNTSSPSTTRANSVSPAATATAGYPGGEDIMSASQDILRSSSLQASHLPTGQTSHGTRESRMSFGNAGDLDELFNTKEYFGIQSPVAGGSTDPSAAPTDQGISNTFNGYDFSSMLGSTSSGLPGSESNITLNGLNNGGLGRSSISSGMGAVSYDTSPYNDFSINLLGMDGSTPLGQSQSQLPNYSGLNGAQNSGFGGMQGMNNMTIGSGGSFSNGQPGGTSVSGLQEFTMPEVPALGTGLNFDFTGFGGEMLAGEGMDTVSDGLQGGENQGLSAATILSLLEEGSFDYGAMFTDQAPLGAAANP